jgi:hypothetical protein
VAGYSEVIPVQYLLLVDVVIHQLPTLGKYWSLIAICTNFVMEYNSYIIPSTFQVKMSQLADKQDVFAKQNVFATR